MTENQITQRDAISPQIEPQDDEETIDLVELAYALLAKWKLIAIAALACALVGGIYAFLIATPQYEASATIYVVSNKDSAINLSDLQLGSALTSDYIEVFKMWEVHEQVISNLDLSYTYSQMNGMLSVTNTSNTRMIEITFTSPSAQEAADVANEYAAVARDYIAEKMVTDRPTIMSTALVPSSPVSPNKTKIVLIAGALGFVAACVAVTVIALLNDTYKTAEDIKKYTGLVTLATIPLEKTDDEQPRSAKKLPKLNLPGGFTL